MNIHNSSLCILRWSLHAYAPRHLLTPDREDGARTPSAGICKMMGWMGGCVARVARQAARH
jgi:hypothetical protein